MKAPGIHASRLLLILFLADLSALPVRALVLFTTLILFNGTNGANPLCRLIQAKTGILYDTTTFGGTNFATDSALTESNPSTNRQPTTGRRWLRNETNCQ